MNKMIKALPAVFLLAACSSTTEVPQETEAVRDYIAAADLEQVNYHNTLELAQRAERAGARRFIFISSVVPSTL